MKKRNKWCTNRQLLNVYTMECKTLYLRKSTNEINENNKDDYEIAENTWEIIKKQWRTKKDYGDTIKNGCRNSSRGVFEEESRDEEQTKKQKNVRKKLTISYIYSKFEIKCYVNFATC